jgi:hypothetical protein
MSFRAVLRTVVVALVGAAVPAVAITVPEIGIIARCQKQFAGAGASFAQKVIRSTLKCTNAVIECQVQCDYGVFGASCDTSPPPCCDPDDPGSNEAFGECMAKADDVCTQQNAKMAQYETQKQTKITNACSPLTQEQLCGADGDGLNFAVLNAGCLALDPNYTCSLTNILNCVGGPLQRQLTDRIGSLLDPRAGDAVAALNLQAEFPGIPVTRKVKEDLPAGKADVWAFTGQAGDEITVRVKTRNDNGNGTSNLHPVVTLLAADMSPVADTNVRNVACPVPNVCGAPCPQFTRTLPFNGTFHVAVRAAATGACTGGGYRLVVTSPGGGVPVLVAEDATP